MKNSKKWKKILKECNTYTFSNLKINYTPEIKESDLKPYYFLHYIEAYLLSNFRLSILKRDLNRISDINEKRVKVFLTADKEFYRDILKEEGMFWVKELKQKFGFVSKDINIIHIDYEVLTKYLPPRSSELDSLCHEFTHILVPQYLDMKWEEFNRYWNNIYDEGFAVLLNKQYKYICNIRKDIKNKENMEFSKINIEYLSKNGFFTVDDRFVTENFEYQYCASIVKKTDDLIRKEKEYKNKRPLGGLFSYILNKEDKGECIEDDLLEDFGIDIKVVEEGLRKDLNLS